MSLADYWSERDYLPEGWHICTVKEYRVFPYNSGNNGVEFILADNARRTTKLSFCLVDTILWQLARFAKHCGITQEQAKKYNPQAEGSHRVLVGKHVQARIVKGAPNAEGKSYNECAETAPVGTATQAPPPQTGTDEQDIAAIEAAKENESTPTGDDIPF